MPQNNIRNFCIIAHIDHGKSTLADRMLEITGTVEKRKMKEQLLDMMDLERERGITIKLQPVRMNLEVRSQKLEVRDTGYRIQDTGYRIQDTGYQLNLIDTPGHVDFNYEVSRSLAAVEGAVLLVDAAQGVQAQTLANLYLALEQNLAIIPVVNKIDLPNADVPRTKKEIIKLLGCNEEEILTASGKTGEGVDKILQTVIEKVPAPRGESSENLQALIFDSKFDDYKGVVAYVRVMNGSIKTGDKIKMMATKAESEVVEVGIFKPELVKCAELSTGEIGYISTGLKEVSQCRVGDTVTSVPSNVKPLPGYKLVKPMVYAGIFCKDGSYYQKLRESIEKMRLTDAALSFEPEHSKALGFGFRCGFLGMLHLEIFQERLKREYDLEMIVSVPSVAYKVFFRNSDQELVIKSPQELPDPAGIDRVEEPWVKADIVLPANYLGKMMQFVEESKGLYKNTEYLDEQRAILHYEIPLSAILVDFYDKLKSISSGYASLNYELADYHQADVVKMDILVAEEPMEALSSLVYKEEAYRAGRHIVESLKKSIPRQMFEVKLQAAIGGKIIASERIPAMRKDVIAKLYGGDVTRKMKLLEKQKKGKKKMKEMGKGRVDIPAEAFLAVLKK